MSRKLIACAALGFGMVCGFIPPAALADSASDVLPAQAAVDAEYQRDLKRLRDFRHHRNLKGLENLAEEIQAKWSQRDEQQYFDLMAIIVSQFSSYLDAFAADKQQYLLAQKYARLALQKSDKMSLETETQFLMALMNDPEYDNGSVQDEQWSRMRSEKVQLMLNALQRIDQQIDRDNGATRIIGLRPPSPPGSFIGHSGMTPEAIKARIQDPKVLAEYELMLADYYEQMRQSQIQSKLRRVEQRYLMYLDRYLAKSYSMQPHNTEELQRYLNLYVRDETRKTQMMAQVEKRIDEKRRTEELLRALRRANGYNW